MTTFRNVSNPPRPVDLDTGRVLAPGESGDAETSDRHDGLITDGHLEVPEPVTTPAEDTSASQKKPVASSSRTAPSTSASDASADTDA